MSYRLLFVFLLLLVNSYIINAENPISSDLCFNNLIIYGKSNVRNFSFELNYDACSIPSENVSLKKNDFEIEFLIPVNRLKTLNKFIQHDFFKMINAERFPYIRLSIDNDQMELITSGKMCETLNAIITIAEKSKQYCIPIIKGGQQTSKQFITGKTELLLTDFNLIPLSKFLGLVKVENSVVIDFKINFNPSQI